MGQKKNSIELNLQVFMDKVKKMERGEKLDLSSDEDLSIAIMNLISIEEHLFFSYGRTKDVKYLNLLDEVREMRKQLLKRIIKEYQGEVWCISKHLLAASMRLMEVGTKFLTKGEKKQAVAMFDKSYHLYSLFWGLNLGVIKVKDVKQKKSKKLNFLGEENRPKVKKSASIFEKLGDLVRKAIDCCIE